MNETSNVESNVYYPLYDIDYSKFHNSSHERGFVQSAIFGIFACVWSIIFNTVLIFLTVWRPEIKSQFVFMHILSLSVCDLLYSTLVDIITIYFDLQPWNLGIYVCKAWMILDVLIPFVSLLIICELCLDRILFALSPIGYFRLVHRWIFRITALSVPWILASAILIPLWLLTSVMEPSPSFCIYGITQEAAVTSLIVSLLLPCAFIIILTVFILATAIGRLPQDLEEFVSLTFSGGGRIATNVIKKRHMGIVVALTFVNIFTVVMQLPYGTISIFLPTCLDPNCTSSLKLLQALSWLRSASPGLRPVFWILITELRHVCCSCDDELSPTTGGLSTHLEMTSITNTNVTNEPMLNTADDNDKPDSGV